VSKALANFNCTYVHTDEQQRITIMPSKYKTNALDKLPHYQCTYLSNQAREKMREQKNAME